MTLCILCRRPLDDRDADPRCERVHLSCSIVEWEAMAIERYREPPYEEQVGGDGPVTTEAF